MFYSRELLARKASLGEIWLLGTRQAKLDRRKANKLDIARLCEEILNPPVPIALRLSSILMGGVVILYEKKVLFLHDDANRLLVDIRNAWKVMEEPTLLPKRKAKAKRKSITLPENEEETMGYTNFGEPEEEISMGFQQNNVNMRLDQVDDYYIINDQMDDNLTNHHQADVNDITLDDLLQPNAGIHGQYERFEETDEGTQVNYTFEEHTRIPTTPIPSPARQDRPQKAENPQQLHPKQDQKRQGRAKQKAPRAKGIVLDEDQTIIPNHEYQSWLHDTSDIVSRRGRKKRRSANILSTSTITKLMQLPSIVLMDDMFVKGYQDIPYPEPLLDLWKKSIQPNHDSPTVRNSQPKPPEPSPPKNVQDDHPVDYPFEDLHSGVGSPSHAATIELQRASMLNKVTPVGTNQFVTPGNSGDAVRYSGSSVSGDAVPPTNVEVNLERGGSKNNILPSNSKKSHSSLDTVVEAFHETDTDYLLSKPKRKKLTPDQELLVETQLTMDTPAYDPPDIMTENIKKHMKTHFEAPGAPKVESLNNLATGLNRKGAALLFYQTCVLASQDVLRVEQKVPFGDIFISKGGKM